MMVSSNRCLKKSSGVLSSGIRTVGPAAPRKGKGGGWLSVLQSAGCQESGALRSHGRARGLGPPHALLALFVDISNVVMISFALYYLVCIC